MTQRIYKERSVKDRLPGNRHSAMWSVPGGYDLFVYAVAPRRWQVGDGILATREDQRVADHLRGQHWPTRRQALAAVQAARLFLSSSNSCNDHA